MQVTEHWFSDKSGIYQENTVAFGSLGEGGDADHLAPFSALQCLFRFAIAQLDANGSHPEPVGGIREQIRHYALMRLALVDLTELLHALELYSAAVLEDVLQVQHVWIGARLLASRLAGFDLRARSLGRVAPLELHSV